MLAGDPANTAVLFGLAKEYEKAGDETKLIETLERYLAAADDEGNAYGMLARAYERIKANRQGAGGLRARHRGGDGAWPSGHGRRISRDFGKRVLTASVRP